MFAKRPRNASVDGAYIVFQMIPVNDSQLLTKNPKTSAVVGNLRIKDVAGDVVLESWNLNCISSNF